VKHAHLPDVSNLRANFKRHVSAPVFAPNGKRFIKPPKQAILASMFSRHILYFSPADGLAALTGTGLLAQLIETYPKAQFHIIAPPDQFPLFDNLPVKARLLAFPAVPDAASRARLASALMGRIWHLVVNLRGSHLPALLWALRRMETPLEPEAYGVPDLSGNGAVIGPHLFLPDKIHVPLPAALLPETPLIVLAPDEAARADWTWQHYGELAWRLAEYGAPFDNAHFVLLSTSGTPLADNLMGNLPAGQITRLDDLSLPRRAKLLQRSLAYVGSERFTARLAAMTGVPVVMRLQSAPEIGDKGRPYGLYSGKNVAALAGYLVEHGAKYATSAAQFANHETHNSNRV
jgi:ADP-heptose:LPS heptosyltransferase